MVSGSCFVLRLNLYNKMFSLWVSIDSLANRLFFFFSSQIGGKFIVSYRGLDSNGTVLTLAEIGGNYISIIYIPTYIVYS